MSGEAPATRQRSELHLRMMSGVVMVLAAVATLWWGGWPFAIFWIAAGAAAGREWSRITAPDGQPIQHIFFGAAVATTGLLVVLHQPLLAAIWAAVMLGLNAFGPTGVRREQAIGFLYASAIAVAPVVVRAEPGVGAALVAWCFAVVWSTDIAAYFTGRAFGGPKLWPSVSPKKTWSGAIGGATAGVLAGVLVALVTEGAGADWPWPLWLTVLMGLVASAAGQLGDLAESALKRRHGVKDSGRLIPGHGGVLDRLDAFVVVVTLVALARISVL